MQIAAIGLDLAKAVFQVHGVNDFGQAIVGQVIPAGPLSDFALVVFMPVPVATVPIPVVVPTAIMVPVVMLMMTTIMIPVSIPPGARQRLIGTRSHLVRLAPPIPR